jgi:hypothetical protein
MELNDDQKKIFGELDDFLKSKNKFYLLTGLAGTGKTFLITYFLSQPDLLKKKIAITGCTNKAVGVLESSFRRFIPDKEKDDLETSSKSEIAFLTIHKLLQIKRKINLDGEEIFESTIDENNIKIKSKSIFYYDVIIIDEVSMLNKDLTLQLLRLKDKLKGKIIFLGDKAQLPPVQESESYIFELATSSIPHGNLTKIMRSGDQIVKFVNSIRILIENPLHKVPFAKLATALENATETKINLYRDEEKWINMYLNNAKKGHTDQIMLCYTNKRVDYLNKRIRKSLYGTSENDYVSGEKIIFNTSYRLPSNQNKYDSSEMATIKSASEDDVRIRPFYLFDLLNIRFPVIALNKAYPMIQKSKKVPALLNEAVEIEESGVEISPNICLVCYDSSNLVNHECHHHYCDKCYDIWIRKHKTCPMCKVKSDKGKLVFINDPKLTTMIETLRNETSNVKYKIWLLMLDNKDLLNVIHPTQLKSYENDVESIKEHLREIKEYLYKKYHKKDAFWDLIMQQLWDFYYFYFVDQFAQINYGNAITTHRSQGSTYPRVYVDLIDIVKCNTVKKEAYQCLYTAVTRASHYLDLYF